jgi:hypothetical protein
MADEKKALPVYIDKIGLQKPFDPKVCKGAPDVVWDILDKAFSKSKAFELVQSQPKEKGFVVAGSIQNLKREEKKQKISISGKLSIVLAETPGRSFFGNLSQDGSVDDVNPKKVEASVEDLAEALADALAGDAVKQCEKRAAK